MEAEHYFASSAAPEDRLDSHTAHGTYAERRALMPYTQSAEGACSLIK